ncbi:hypothetical protein [Streptomyces werraensis]|uniref:hypothetical protein n=1 Tax=Streptomyces werraensis TaxID=68284 RepID=UPI001CE2F7DE
MSLRDAGRRGCWAPAHVIGQSGDGPNDGVQAVNHILHLTCRYRPVAHFTLADQGLYDSGRSFSESKAHGNGDLDLNADRFPQQVDAVLAARDAFLDVCWEVLAYTACWWQVRRRIREGCLLREQAER